jgi:type IV secretory pathway VirB2 component (pilin)
VIDWYDVIVNSFWILGLAIILAAVSYHHWLAGEANRSLRAQLESPAFQLPAWIGFCLICIGLAGGSGRVWETIIWIIFGLIGLFYSVQNGLTLRHASRSSDTDGN